MTPLQSAQLARQCGISVLPPKQDGTKAPDAKTWSQYQHKRASEAEIDAWYEGGRTGVGWVCGKVSGNLEIIDFDDRSAFAEYGKLCADAGLSNLLDKICAGYLEHSPNGAHLAYRCKEIEGNQKLAQNKEKKSLIETRGEGGFIIVAPTHGGVNLRGEYSLQSGSPETIAMITADERRSLFDVARMMDEGERPVFEEPKVGGNGGTRPGDAYNQSANWDEILSPSGWVRVTARLGVVSWRRPGKEVGISATTNHADSDLFYVFSTSTEFEPNRGYSKFSTYAILNHGGDFSAAARELKMLGYGVEAPEPVTGEVDLSHLYAKWGIGPKVHKHPPIADLLRVPGVIGELAEWMNACAHKRQPILALGASIAAFSAVLGRKVQTSSGVRSNVYAIGIGNTGSGKEKPRECISNLFGVLGEKSMVGESFASATAVEEALFSHPRHTQLFLIDEIGYFLGSMKSESTAGHVKAIIPMMMKIYTSSNRDYRRQTFADKKRNENLIINQPSLSIWGTTVPRNFFSGITKEHAMDGFLNRWLIFSSNEPDPEPQKLDIRNTAVPESIKSVFRHWLDASINPTESGNLKEQEDPFPLIVEMTKRAESVFDGLQLMLREKRKELREKHGVDSGQDGPYVRTWEMAVKLALIRACGIKLGSPEITEEDAQWGADLSWYITDTFIEKFDRKVSEDKIEEGVKRLTEWMGTYPHGTKIERSIITRSNQWMGKNRAEIYSLAIESSIIGDDRGRPRKHWLN